MTITPIYDSVVANIGVPALHKVRVHQIAKALNAQSKEILPSARRWGARSASSSVTRFEADCVVEDYSDGAYRLVFTQDGTIFVAFPGDTHNNVLRRAMLRADLYRNPPLGQGNWVPADDKRSWLVLRDLGMGFDDAGIRTRFYEMVNLATAQVIRVPERHITCIS